jgi:hypothetical protein
MANRTVSTVIARGTSRNAIFRFPNERTVLFFFPELMEPIELTEPMELSLMNQSNVLKYSPDGYDHQRRNGYCGKLPDIAAQLAD